MVSNLPSVTLTPLCAIIDANLGTSLNLARVLWVLYDGAAPKMHGLKDLNCFCVSPETQTSS